MRSTGGHPGNQHQKKSTVAERFWSKVAVRGAAECWTWSAFTDSNGYGKFFSGRRQVSAHRQGWELQRGPVPEGLEVCHNCPCGDNPACVNAAHLWLGTHAENMADMRAKGRWFHAFGERSGRAVLTDDLVREIRARLRSGARSCDVAKALDLKPTLVYEVASGRTWRHVA